MFLNTFCSTNALSLSLQQLFTALLESQISDSHVIYLAMTASQWLIGKESIPLSEGDLVWFLGWEGPPGKGIGCTSSTFGLRGGSLVRICLHCGRPGRSLAWEIPWRRERLTTYSAGRFIIHGVTKYKAQLSELSLCPGAIASPVRLFKYLVSSITIAVGFRLSLH